MKEKLRKEETTVFIGVSIALLGIRSGSEAVMKYNGTKQIATDNQRPHPEHAVFGKVDKQLPAPDQHTEQEQRGRLEETSVAPRPQQAEQLAVPKVGLDHRPEIRLREERVHALAVNAPYAGCRHIVGIHHRIEEFAEFERLEHQDNGGNQDCTVTPFANQYKHNTDYGIKD